MIILPINRDHRRILEAFMRIPPEDRHANLIAQMTDTTPSATREHLESLRLQGLAQSVFKEQGGKSRTFWELTDVGKSHV